MTGDQFLDLAGELFAKNRTPSEALCRTIVSRAYYGAFHLARTYTVQLGFPETDKHRFLADSLRSSGEPNVVAAGDLLGDLATERGKADYDLAKSKVIKQVQETAFLKRLIEQALDIKSRLEKANTEEAKSTAKVGIAAYWRTKS